MESTTRKIAASKNIALVAHDHCKPSLLAWAKKNNEKLQLHKLFATGTTGSLVNHHTGLHVTGMLSGPMGGDQQIGAMIAEQRIDLLIFFWDPLNAVPHDPDVKALLRLATVWNIPVATNAATADFLITSPYFDETIDVVIPDYQSYLDKRTR
ncbi:MULTISPECIES: methylglyoxal synthase [Providencia]|uniref:Methylglyoxal synthase n=1 Tax=Providencia heimbachae ATCC 35613 TaxID=1354272 RepID=A0A1B7K0L0_9GAMM|nr:MULTISPECIES: methylglyoxal synthase [Providencia]MBP6120851.1 methylglyoxal synthase [Providencia sp.]MDD9339634.1 methylglyoxal synthase [Providencia heimbachae]NIH23310.1 methylglyoxal synthase [Providencia heimbachae]OAT53669.1 methylglyoxal synthase [Providencia heimbachae ATCC 35613]SQH13972.1 Methylglyoxal synthase [Providencia heimbachae]